MARLRWALAAAVLLSLTCASSRAEATGDPSLDWWTIETAHFRIHYEKNLEFVAEHVARLGEAIHKRLIGPLGYSPDVKTELLLTDVVDNSNGSATAVPYNAIRMFVTAPDDLSPLADYDDWYLGLLTHEYTHILHIDNASGLATVGNLLLGKTFVPNQVQPRWIIEGLATVVESTFSSGGRIRSSLFEMFIRADFLDDNVARLDQISSNSQRWPRGTMFYLYGSRFLQWIVDVYGADVLRAVAADYGAGLIPWGINRAIRRQTGKTYVELYEGFKDTMKRRYAVQMKQVERRGLRQGKRLTHHGMTVSYPRFVPRRARQSGGRYQLHYFRADDHERPGIYHIDLSTDQGGGRRPETLVAHTRIPTPASYSPNGDLLFAGVVPFKQIYQRRDLFQLPKGERAPTGRENNRARLTIGARANTPTVSPDGRHVVFTLNHRGTTRLAIADREVNGDLKRIRTLVASEPFDQVYTPQYSPDGRKVAYSAWSAGGFRDIRVVDMATGNVESITYDRAMDHNPTWSPDGDKLYFASDRTGIFNIYEYSFDGRALKQVTNVRVGAMQPAISEDGKRLVYAGYTSRGWDLWLMDLDPSRYLEAASPPNDRPQPFAQPPPVKMTKNRYSPWRTLRPRSWEWEIAQGDYDGTSFSIGTAGADIVGHHAVSAQVLVEVDAPGPELTFNYGYRRLPVDLGLQLGNRWTPRANYSFDNQLVDFDEESYFVRSAISYPDRGEFVAQTASLSYTAAITDATLPVNELQPFDPYASVTAKPLRGLIGTVHLGYAISSTESSVLTAGAARGFALSLGMDVADDFTGSQESLYAATYVAQGYIPMPWGAHTLAVRSAGGMATGSYTSRTLFFVGGYNLENTGFPDVFTSTVFNGAFVLRGYEPNTYRGQNYILNQLEYRLPIARVDRGIQTLPLFLRRIDGNLFVDWGGAFNRFNFDDVKLFHDRSIIASKQLHTGAGAELWFGMDVGYVVPLNLRLGYALGFSEDAIAGGRAYFIGSSAF